MSNKTLKNLIKLDLSLFFKEFIEQAVQRSTMDNRVFEKLGKEYLADILESRKEDLSIAIGRYIRENGFVQETVNDKDIQFNYQTVIDSTIYIIKPENIEKFLNAIASYIVSRWLKEE
ncbi:unnamed protein product [marine sediment metagenome]|uniref:Uncharacterized protein n=1 Tax=marine sediment metagenome TaxID=412755 RepID=X0WSE5_9ZZZZ